MPKSYRPELLSRRRQYIGGCLIGIGVAAALMALWVGWLLDDVAAQTDDGSLTVGECLSEVTTSVGPVGEALIKEDIVAGDLLPTKVTDGMCEDMLERAPDGTLVQTLVAEQNYIQEIKLIENSIREAETAENGNQPSPSGVSFLLARATAGTIKGPVQAQYTPNDSDSTPTATATATATATSSAGGGGNGAGAGGTTVSNNRVQAARVSEMAATTVADSDASIADMLNQLEAAAFNESNSRSEAARSARCALEQALLKAVSKELVKGQYIRVSPNPTPKEMEYRDTATIKLLISGEVIGLYENLGQQYEKVAEASEAEEGCMVFVKSMEAKLFPRSFAIDPHQAQEPRRITHDTTWSWDITANAEGKNSVALFVGHTLQLGELELQPRWVEPAPVRDAVITVRARPLPQIWDFVGRTWQWLLPVSITLSVAAVWLVAMLKKRAQRRLGEPADEG